NGKLVDYRHHRGDYSTTVLTQKAVDFIADASGPFFLYFAPIAPHEPATPAPQDVGRYSAIAPWRPPSYDEPAASDKPWAAAHPQLDPATRASIDAIHEHMLESLRAVDRSVGRLVEALKAKGALDHTVVMFASDNGYLW